MRVEVRQGWTPERLMGLGRVRSSGSREEEVTSHEREDPRITGGMNEEKDRESESQDRTVKV